MRLADRIVVMANGEILQGRGRAGGACTTSRRICSSPRFVGSPGMNFVEGEGGAMVLPDATYHPQPPPTRGQAGPERSPDETAGGFHFLWSKTRRHFRLPPGSPPRPGHPRHPSRVSSPSTPRRSAARGAGARWVVDEYPRLLAPACTSRTALGRLIAPLARRNAPLAAASAEVGLRLDPRARAPVRAPAREKAPSRGSGAPCSRSAGSRRSVSARTQALAGVSLALGRGREIAVVPRPDGARARRRLLRHDRRGSSCPDAGSVRLGGRGTWTLARAARARGRGARCSRNFSLYPSWSVRGETSRSRCARAGPRSLRGARRSTSACLWAARRARLRIEHLLERELAPPLRAARCSASRSERRDRARPGRACS